MKVVGNHVLMVDVLLTIEDKMEVENHILVGDDQFDVLLIQEYEHVIVVTDEYNLNHGDVEMGLEDSGLEL